jgi:DNA-binding NarL/FixJ family response regulator
MANNRPKIIIADDHILVAEGLAKLLETEYDVIATVVDGHALVRTAIALRPQIIVTDVSMPLLNGLDAGGKVKKILPSVKLVFFTMNKDPDLAAEAFRRGASAYLLKTCTSTELMSSLRKVLEGSSYIPPALAKEMIDLLLHPEQRLVDQEDRLSHRQREVLQLLAEGMCHKQVANVLNMTARTVWFHKQRIYERLGLSSSAELVQYAVRNHIITA